jgi:hypothetical protein
VKGGDGKRIQCDVLLFRLLQWLRAPQWRLDRSRDGETPLSEDHLDVARRLVMNCQQKKRGEDMTSNRRTKRQTLRTPKAPVESPPLMSSTIHLDVSNRTLRRVHVVFLQ